MMMYHLKYWGGIQNNDRNVELFGTAETDFWFDSMEDREAFKCKLKRIADAASEIIVFRESNGPLCTKRTVAVMKMKYAGIEYPLEYDFGFGDWSDDAAYMFNEGNYSCDCNRSLFLCRANVRFPGELDCGNKIEVTSFEIEYREAPV
jgi:hypothetical protein